mgnify:CR=1 FL=1
MSETTSTDEEEELPKDQFDFEYDEEKYDISDTADYPITEDDMIDYLEEWELFDTNDDDVNTRSRSEEAFRKFCHFLDKQIEKEYHEVEHDDMHEFVKYLVKRDLSDLNVQNLFGSIREFLTAQDIDAADDINLRKKPYNLSTKTIAEQNLPEGIHYLEIEEHQQMLDACESLREKLVCELLWATGVRRSELVSIKIDHIDFDERSIWVDNAKNPNDRDVFYGPRCANILKRWMDYGRQQYAYADESDYLLCSSHSAKLQDKYPNEIVKRVADRAGLLTSYGTDAAGRTLHHPTAHSYRHSFAVHRLDMNLKPLSDLLGHQSVETTAETYMELRDKDLKEQNDKYRPKF